VRRLSIASRDSGAESREHASASALLGREAPGVPAGNPCGSGSRTFQARTRLGAGNRDTPGTAPGWLSWQVGTGVSPVARRENAPVVDRQSARWYVKDIRASTRRWVSNDLP
jgi:hypothetical protein